MMVDISPLASLTALKVVNLSNNIGLANLFPLTGITTLESLNIANISATDLAPLQTLINIESLTIENIPATDLTPLVPMLKLNFFRADGVNVGEGGSDLSYRGYQCCVSSILCATSC